MTDAGELAEALTKLSDVELVSVVATATDGRAALGALHEVAASLAATTSHVPLSVSVSPDTHTDGVSESVGALEQVGAAAVITGIPVPTADIGPGPGIGGYSPAGVPTFESVRDKVEQRYGTAQGMDELDRQTPAGRSADEQWDARAKAARERLEQIRKSVRGNDTDKT
ncbi:hypothetical protein HLB23_36560 [Nocardia uniformis]|uniref:Uncharacterized protein n=1 Tax=Nocardia uniformis TaxID=53432 RepID=A0A849C9H8_9NOCA|nr:hypothetical protein [Nocardia uniformis]NNH75304.1 hypothetical protein [Nocardia uniformis]